MKLHRFVQVFVMCLFVICCTVQLAHLQPWAQWTAVDKSLVKLNKLEKTVSMIVLLVAIASALLRTRFALQWSVSTLTALWMFQTILASSGRQLLYTSVDTQIYMYLNLTIVVVGNLLGIILTCESESIVHECTSCNSRSVLEQESVNIFHLDAMPSTNNFKNNNRKYSINSDYFKAEDRDDFYPKHFISSNVNI